MQSEKIPLWNEIHPHIALFSDCLTYLRLFWGLDEEVVPIYTILCWQPQGLIFQ